MSHLTELGVAEHGRNCLGLNVNAGAVIKLQLRDGRNDAFRPYEDVVDVALHELVHNTIGSHSAAFYDLLNEYRNAHSIRLFQIRFGRIDPRAERAFEGRGTKLGEASATSLSPSARALGSDGRSPTRGASTLAGKAAMKRYLDSIAKEQMRDLETCGNSQTDRAIELPSTDEEVEKDVVDDDFEPRKFPRRSSRVRVVIKRLPEVIDLSSSQ